MTKITKQQNPNNLTSTQSWVNFVIQILSAQGTFDFTMHSKDISSVSQSELDWPPKPPGILIMGKRQGTKKENKQLRGRTALAAALWHSAPHPKPYLLFVASDWHGPKNKADADVVKSVLMQQFDIPGDFILTRQKTNCTLLEVRAAKTLCRTYGLDNIFAITHLYHAPRAQRYINEVLPNAAVIPVHPDILDEIVFPLETAHLFNKIQTAVADSLPGPFDLLREHAIEWLLNLAHTIDRRGRFERFLARLLRPNAY